MMMADWKDLRDFVKAEMKVERMVVSRVAMKVDERVELKGVGKVALRVDWLVV